MWVPLWELLQLYPMGWDHHQHPEVVTLPQKAACGGRESPWMMTASWESCPSTLGSNRQPSGSTMGQEWRARIIHCLSLVLCSSSIVFHPSSLVLHPSSLVLHPSSLVLCSSTVVLHPSSLVIYPSSLTPHPSPSTPHPSPSIPIRRAPKHEVMEEISVFPPHLCINPIKCGKVHIFFPSPPPVP